MIMCTTATIFLLYIVAFVATTNRRFADAGHDTTEEFDVMCCESESGTRASFDTDMCGFNNDLYYHNDFRYDYCGCITDATSTPVSSCLGCCLDVYRDHRYQGCGEYYDDSFGSCSTDIVLQFLSCENGCVETCQLTCKVDHSVCRNSCAGSGLSNCESNCLDDFFTCNNACNDERAIAIRDLILY